MKKQSAIRSKFLSTPLVFLIAALTTGNVTAQSQEQQVLGFESLSHWTASAGTSALSSTHSEGMNALALKEFSYAELTSVPLATLSDVSDELAVDIRLPSPVNWGQAQIYFTSHTLGLHTYRIGEANFINLSAGSFHSLKFPVSSSTQNTLKQAYADLTFKIVLNMPYTAAPVIIDNLRFTGTDEPPPSCEQNSGYNLVVTVEGEFDNEILENMICTFHTVYPQLAARFNPNAPQTVNMRVADIDFIAGASGNNMVYMRQHMLNNPNDTDVVVHEGMHIVQAYTGNTPGWLTEGIADYVRDSYGLNNAAAGWTLQRYRYGQHYTWGYGVVGKFLQWLETHHTADGAPIVDQLDQLLRSGNYSQSIWTQWTGNDIDTLWHLYSVDEGAIYGEQAAPLPAEQGITVFGDANFEGTAILLDVGDYRPADLTARGAPTDWVDPTKQDAGISSLIVPQGYKVTLYTNADFTGASVQYTANEAFIGSMNDNVYSLRVEQLP